MAAPERILMVCLGNICRSPMAEGALVHRLAGLGLASAAMVDSAGLGRWHAGDPPDARAIACAARHGVDISGQRARQLRERDFADFDWLLCADRSVLHAVRAAAPPAAAARVELLLVHAGAGDPDEVPDPYPGGRREFEHAWSLVDGAAAAIARRLHGAGA